MLGGVHAVPLRAERGLHHRGHRVLQVQVDRPFGASQRRGGQRGQPAGEVHRLVEQFVARHHPVRQAYPDGFGRAHPLPEEQQFLGPRQPDDKRQHHGPAVPGDQPHLDVRVGQVGPLRHQHQVTEQGQAAAKPDGRPVHRRDHRHRAPNHAGDDAARLRDVLLPERLIPLHPGHHVKVPARTERPPAAGQHHRPRRLVRGEAIPDARQRGVQRLARGVALLRPVQFDQPDGPLGGHHEFRRKFVHENQYS